MTVSGALSDSHETMLCPCTGPDPPSVDIEPPGLRGGFKIVYHMLFNDPLCHVRLRTGAGQAAY